MKMTNRSAFTLLEVIIVAATLALAAAVFLTTLPGKPRSPAGRIKCVNNLKNVGLAFRIYATDNMNRFPWEDLAQNREVKINYSTDPTTYIRAVTTELVYPIILICPAETRRPATNWTEFSRLQLSYFISPD